MASIVARVIRAHPCGTERSYYGVTRGLGDSVAVSRRWRGDADNGAIAQLRTTDLKGSIRFYTTEVGLELEFQYEDFYAGIRAGNQIVHLKLVDQKDPSIAFVDEGEHFHLYLETDDAKAAAAMLRSNGVALVKDVHETALGDA